MARLRSLKAALEVEQAIRAVEKAQQQTNAEPKQEEMEIVNEYLQTAECALRDALTKLEILCES